MIARLRKLLSLISDSFWVLPAFMVLIASALAILCVELDRSGRVPRALLTSAWIYNGGGTGARTLLGAVAASAIGVASTVFSITIAALSLAAGQMGPRLLRSFTRDRGNQLTLGGFLGTFAYALLVLRSVRTQEEGPFTPHLALSVGILLALCCVGALIYFVGHIASRINVDTVIDLVSADVRTSLLATAARDEDPQLPASESWHGAVAVVDDRSGYLQQLHADGLAQWAAEHQVRLRLLVRPGDFIFPGAPIALVVPDTPGVGAAIREATALGGQRTSAADVEYALRQLVEVATRALSPGINDPFTAITVLDRLGASLCEMSGRALSTGIFRREGKLALIVPSVDYDGLADAMFHMIRQSATGNVAVLVRLLEVLTAVSSCETLQDRQQSLQRHADLVLGDAERSVSTPGDLLDIRRRHERFASMRAQGASQCLAQEFSR